MIKINKFISPTLSVILVRKLRNAQRTNNWTIATENHSKYSIAYTLGAGDGDGLKKNYPCHTFANAKLQQWTPHSPIKQDITSTSSLYLTVNTH